MKKNKWIKLRHSIVRNVAYLIMYPYSKVKYGITIDKFKNQEKRPYLVLYNHQTAYDQFFVGMALKGSVYYLATEDIFSLGFLSSIIRCLVAPIPIKKQTLDVSAIKTCIRVAKEGGTIAIAPEGNRTFSGKTEYINPAIASLAKKLGLPIILYRIEGGYGVHPRWSDVVRKGRMRTKIAEVIMPEEYAELSKEELAKRINKGLYVDEANADNSFFHKKSAEYLERALYVCPHCGLSTFYSDKDRIRCEKCEREIRFNPDTSLEGIGFDLKFPFVAQWYDYQKDYINNLDVTRLTDKPVYTEDVSLFDVIVYKKKVLREKNARISLYGDRIVVKENESSTLEFTFDEIGAVTILGKNKLNIYTDDNVYQIKGSKRFNALKYVHIYNRYLNIKSGNENEVFLGM